MRRRHPPIGAYVGALPPWRRIRAIKSRTRKMSLFLLQTRKAGVSHGEERVRASFARCARRGRRLCSDSARFGRGILDDREADRLRQRRRSLDDRRQRDGTQLVFVDAGGDLAVAPAAGGAPQKLGTTTAAESEPSWSPDGSRIAYVAAGELFVMDADGSNRQQLTSNAVSESSPSWAPGGDEVVYAASGNLFAITPSGSVTRLLADASGASQPSWGLAVANTVAPTITPEPGAAYAEGTQLSASAGSWISISGITSFAYQWKRCGPAGTGCSNIAGATGGTYMLSTGDIGGTVRVAVTATTADGSAPGTSAATPVVSAAAPKNVTPPTISGTAVVGETLTASTGIWSGSNPVFTYQWQKCDANGTAASC